jgi:hypothetical protein
MINIEQILDEIIENISIRIMNYKDIDELNLRYFYLNLYIP